MFITQLLLFKCQTKSGFSFASVVADIRIAAIFFILFQLYEEQGGIVPSLLIPLLSAISGYDYPLFDSFVFGFLMTTAGMIIFSFTVLLSCIFRSEFGAFLISIVTVGSVFFIMKAKSIHQWSLFDIMNGAKSIDPKTHLITYPLPWIALFFCIIITVTFYILAVKVIAKKDL